MWREKLAINSKHVREFNLWNVKSAINHTTMHSKKSEKTRRERKRSKEKKDL